MGPSTTKYMSGFSHFFDTLSFRSFSCNPIISIVMKKTTLVIIATLVCDRLAQNTYVFVSTVKRIKNDIYFIILLIVSISYTTLNSTKFSSSQLSIYFFFSSESRCLVYINLSLCLSAYSSIEHIYFAVIPA